MRSERRVRLDETCPQSGVDEHWLHLALGRRPVDTVGVRVLRAVQVGSRERAGKKDGDTNLVGSLQ